jgi:hypothetical protein
VTQFPIYKNILDYSGKNTKPIPIPMLIIEFLSV